MEKPTPPQISILIGVYNGEKFVSQAIESLLNQTFSDFELILVDDGSNDNTLSILNSYANKDKRVIVLHQDNTGVAGALNAGLEICKGEYVVRMDADDYSSPNRIAKQVAFMDANPDVVASGTGVMRVDPFGIPLGEVDFHVSHNEIVNELLTGNGSALCQPSCIIRVDALRKSGGYDTRWKVTEDLDLFLRLSEFGNLANLPDILVYWRQHLESVSHSKLDLQVREVEDILSIFCARKDLPFNPNSLLPRRQISHAEQLERWGWSALKNKNRPIALRHFFSSFKNDPFLTSNYKLLACIIRGY